MFPKCRRAAMDLVGLRGEMEARKLSLAPMGKPASDSEAVNDNGASQRGSWPRSFPRLERSRRVDMTNPVHLPGEHRFETTVDGHAGRLDYSLSGDVMTIVHTEVDPALEGRGVAGSLVRAPRSTMRARTGSRFAPVASTRRRTWSVTPSRFRCAPEGPRRTGSALVAAIHPASDSTSAKLFARHSKAGPSAGGSASLPCARASREARTDGNRG